MAAFYGIGLDNAIIEINAQEVPIMRIFKKFIEEFLKLD